MKSFQTTCIVVLAFMAAFVRADDLAEYEDFGGEGGDARIFFANLTNSLVAVNATILAWALISLAVLAAIALALYYLFTESQGSGSGYGYGGQQSGYGQQSYGYSQYARSNDNGFDFASSLNIIQWITMLQDLYEKFDYNDLECQKRLICEVMKEPDYYGATAQKFKAGFQYAKYLEVLSLPDDMRELLDEYLDANSRADGNKQCEEYFQCPYSIKESFKRNLSGNSL